MVNEKGVRELAYIVNIDGIEPIVGSDNCECARVGGWGVMVRKGTFKSGDKAVYFEIDSKLPETEQYAFLASKHYKVKTQKYTFGGKNKDGFYSQGLLMSFEDFGWAPDKYEVGTFLTQELGVTYADAADNARKSTRKIVGEAYKRMYARHPKFARSKIGRWCAKHEWASAILFVFIGKKKDKNNRFPTHFPFIHITDEERCENMSWILENKEPWIKTTKIDGTSSTYILERKHNFFGDKFEYYVCSRNVRQMDRDQKNFHTDMGAEANVYWEMNDKYHIYDFLMAYLKKGDYDYVCLQGETAGPNVQNNPHKFAERQFFGFNLINSKTGRENSITAQEYCKQFNIPWVPIVDKYYILPDDFEIFKKSADGLCEAPGASGMREGYVYRSYDGQQSFKNVSREYLLKH